MKLSPHRRARKMAFTILEVLVATAILSVIVGILFNIFHRASDAWLTGEATVDRQRTSRISLDLLTRELSQAFITTGAANTINFVGQPSWVYFVATVPPAADQVSELGEFGYKWESSGSSNLVRYSSSPTEGNTGWDIRRSNITTMMGTTTNLGTSSTIGEKILSFQFKYFDTNGTLSTTWDSSPGAAQQGMLPAVVEVTMLIMDSRASARIPSGTTQADYLLRHARTNSAVIQLIHAP